uniref:Uncharacterized protein n=1 Tax=Anguilla anguilla TaxID=7936 RepID=A0A0E9S778_ANGAN
MAAAGSRKQDNLPSDSPFPFLYLEFRNETSIYIFLYSYMSV